MSSWSEKFTNLNNGERFVVVASLIFIFLSFVFFFITLAMYIIVIQNQNLINQNAQHFDLGFAYTYGDCFTCASTGCGSLKTTPCMTFNRDVNVVDPLNQNTFFNTPLNLNNLIYFAKSNQQNSDSDIGSSAWFGRQTKILPSTPSPYVFLDGYLLSNNLNTYSIGYFDYDPGTNKTTVCDYFNAEGALYFAIDFTNITKKYMCICVNNPPNPAWIQPTEYCQVAS